LDENLIFAKTPPPPPNFVPFYVKNKVIGVSEKECIKKSS
jgi:hypothetical protein